MLDFQARIKAYMLRHQMVSPGMRVLVGVSGGPDSVALLDVLSGLRDLLGISLAAAHLNHRLRGASADADARYVRQLAEKLGVPCTVEACDVAAYRQEHGLSIQVAAREVRHHFFERVARETGAVRVALGHQADDQVETILHHFLRGTGPAGLAGMLPVRPPFIRPLLAVRRRDIEAYCRERGLDPRQDPSNIDPVYTRNRLRHNLVPLLEAEYNPNLVTTLLRLGEVCREENAYMEGQAVEAFRRFAAMVNGDVRIDARGLAELPLALGRRVVREAWSNLNSGPGALDFEHVERVLSLARAKAGGRRLDLPRGISVEKQAGEMVFTLRSIPLQAAPWRYELQVPGRTELPVVNRYLTAEIMPAEDLKTEALSPGQAAVDLDSLTLPLYVRNRRPGDSFAPQGVGGSMKLKEFFINCKVPRLERDWIPLVLDRRDRLVWVAGYRIADFCKLSPQTRTVVLLSVSKPGSASFESC
ncbi:MAG: tRNA lysidine(34) synthetase TilS [Candidatus Desulforudis sp.]|nr:tRNA lysidine(34) synthetase TilS [Desulforudis sp.]